MSWLLKNITGSSSHGNNVVGAQRIARAVFLFFVFSLLLSIVSFWKNNWLMVQFVPGCISKTKVVAAVPFEYVSKIKASASKGNTPKETVFHAEMEKYETFSNMLSILCNTLEKFSLENDQHLDQQSLASVVRRLNDVFGYNIECRDILKIFEALPHDERDRVLHICREWLAKIYMNGIADDVHGDREIRDFWKNRTQYLFDDGSIHEVMSVNDAVSSLRKCIDTLGLPSDISFALLNIFKCGISPNLVVAQLRGSQAIGSNSDSLRASVPKEKVQQGDVIFEKNSVMTEEDSEKFFAYRNALKSSGAPVHGFDEHFFIRALLGGVFLSAMAAVILVLLCGGSFRNVNIFKVSILIVLQVLMLRLFVQIGEFECVFNNFGLISSFHMLPPALFVTGIMTLIYNVSIATVSGLIVGFFYTMMVSRGLEFFVVYIFANSVFLLPLKTVKSRVKIPHAGAIAGAISAFAVLLKNVCVETPFGIIFYQSVCIFFMCFVSSLLMMTFLPLFEKIFSAYSDMTLSEFGDYNYPLLRKLQASAPGTYNHSVATSNMAEQVAAIVGANTVTCRVGALYHDIGKIGKAAYFIENQSKTNLHDQQTPYVSALIVRNHVRDGVKTAIDNKLPNQIADTIQQHHGTTLMSYFYQKAKNEFLSTIDTKNLSSTEVDFLVNSRVDAAAFRYDGPRPSSKEILIIMLADSIEAASRSIKHVTRQNIENFVNEIFDLKMKDHQFDESKVTFSEIDSMRKAFISTTLSMMHSRIPYNPPVPSSEATNEQGN